MKLDALKLNPALLQKPSVDPNHMDIKKIEETAESFEAMFLGEMLKPMFEGLETDANFGGGKGEDVFKGLLLDEYGKGMAKTGSLGIAEMVKKQLIEMQSKADAGKVAQNMHNQSEVSPVAAIAAAETGEKNDV